MTTCGNCGEERELILGNLCIDCAAAIQREKATTCVGNDYWIICPHCGFREDGANFLEAGLLDDADITELTCTLCEKMYHAIYEVDIEYSTCKPDESFCEQCNKEQEDDGTDSNSE